MLEKHIFISLGSNLGNRLDNLTKALVLLEAEDIEVLIISPIYETIPWGFESTSFYNACAQLATTLTPEHLIKTILRVEEKLGRVRNSEEGYSARIIDLDILSFDDLIINSPLLTLPHPRLHLRNFVLVPLSQIAPSWRHPILKKSISELIYDSPDEALCNPFPLSFWTPAIFEAFPFIAIEGNIGVGKTTLAKKLSDRYQVPILLEGYADNPYLKLFYNEPEKYALDVETFFLNDRLKQVDDFWAQNNGPAVADYVLYKSLVFAAQNLDSETFKKYKASFLKYINKQKSPSILVFLKAEVPHLQNQIKKRGRSYEQNIEDAYLKKIEVGYRKILKTELPFLVLKIDAANYDFKKSEQGFQHLLRKIYGAKFL